MSKNIFLKDTDYYQRNINPFGHYVEQMAHYLHRSTGKPIEECESFIKNKIKTNSFKSGKIQDPVVRFFNRDANGDRHTEEVRLSSYIGSVVKEQEILVPTFTTYINSEKKPSILVEFLDRNVKIRSTSKKEAAQAKAEGNTVRYVMKENDQKNMKTYNNSMSGAFASNGSVLKNPTAHNSLTSITRTNSSIGNASNEKIISGNRHYRNPTITLNNLISVSKLIDRKLLSEVIQKYNLKVPSVQDVESCIKRSSDFYWKDEHAFQMIRSFINKMDDIERAGFVYTGDFYHIRVHNPEFVRNLITRLSTKVKDVEYEDPWKLIHEVDEQIVNYAHQICMSEVRGIAKDYKKLDKQKMDILTATCLNIQNTILEYRDFVEAIFLSRVIPVSTAYIPDMVRRTVVLSDTDSTMFSIDEWVIWYFGELHFREEGYAVAGSVMYIATQAMAHVLAIFSANMNVRRDKLYTLALKPEFVFSVFAQSSVAKHYFTSIIVKEGSVYKEPELEVKGVHLKNSAAPKQIIKNAHEKMADLIQTVIEGNKISLKKEIKEVADIERNIIDSLLSGKTEFYKKSKIKNKEAYSRTEELSPYLYHILWENVFAPKYGNVEQPPYTVIKIPTTLDNPTRLKEWVLSIQDGDLKTRLIAWLSKYNKKVLPTVYISESYANAFSIPKEIIPVVDYKKIALDLTTTNRMILETLGYFPKSELLLSDQGY
mgnify:CR=1 FL=1